MSFHDWWATVVRWLFMPFSQDFLVFPVKKSDTSVKYQKSLNLTHHKQATKFTCLVVHRDAHLSYKRYKVQKTLFQWPSNVHKYQCTQNRHCFYIFLFFFFFEKKINKTKTNKNMLNKAKHKNQTNSKRKQKHTSYANTNKKGEKERKSDRIIWSHFPSMPWKNLSFKCTLESTMRGKN